jgi:hypothetical protein
MRIGRSYYLFLLFTFLFWFDLVHGFQKDISQVDLEGKRRYDKLHDSIALEQ